MRPATVRLLWLIAGMTLVRGALAASIPLFHDEAYYWLWARRLDWGYLDHPPMIAYLVRLGTLGGDGVLWIRAPALVIGAVEAYALFLLGRDLFDEPTGFRAALLSQIVPILGAIGIFAAPDTPMYLAWTVTLRLVWQALHGRPRRWLGAGLAMGAGLLSKLYMGFLGIGLAACLLRSGRPWFRRGEPYLAALVALVVVLPVVYWNAAHEWATVRFLLFERSEPGAEPGSDPILVRLLGQHVALVAVLFPAFVWAGWTAWRRRGDERFAFLLLASLPAAVFPVLVAPLGAARGHLPGPAYIGLAVILAALWNRVVTGLAMVQIGLLAALVAQILIPALPPAPGSREYYGWREAGDRVRQEVAESGGRAVIVAHRYQVAAQLAYHTGGRIPVLLLPRSPAGAIWPDPRAFVGATAVAVTYAPERFRFEHCFRRVEERAPVTITLRGRPIQEFRIFRLDGFSFPCLN
ncbi:MAG: glycosyltransferase family 39 protein [Armatimonadota bacterium]|nr:glycosyltransferase family 39 protein [Armatimonadota bacterium]MDR7549386.1 glycosyltransferase family 39 protein [Armatimonadota bacterium]